MAASFPEYPVRPKVFAMKVARQLMKTCAAQQIGPLGYALVSVVAATEDAAGYKRAVTFYDAQLMMILGIENQKQLAAARNKAVSAGWLKYEHGQKRVPGRYFVTVPEHANLGDDAASDEGGDDIGNGSGSDKERTGSGLGSNTEQTGNRQGTDMAPSFPVPIPVPIPNVCSELREAAPSPPADVVLEFPVTGNKNSPAWWLTKSKVAEYCESFPGLDVEAEARKSLQWLRDNPTKRKTARGMPSFLNRWLSQAQNSGRAAQSQRSPAANLSPFSDGATTDGTGAENFLKKVFRRRGMPRDHIMTVGEYKQMVRDFETGKQITMTPDELSEYQGWRSRDSQWPPERVNY